MLLVLCKNPCVGESFLDSGGFLKEESVQPWVLVEGASIALMESLLATATSFRGAKGAICVGAGGQDSSSELGISSRVPTDALSSFEPQYTSDSSSRGGGKEVSNGRSAWVGL